MVNVVYSPSTRSQSALSATQHRTSPIIPSPLDPPPPPLHGPLTASQNRAVREEWPASGSARSLERTEATTGTCSSPLEQQPVDTVHSRGRTTTDISTHFVKAIVQTSASWNQTSASWNQTSACWNQTSASWIQTSARWKQTSRMTAGALAVQGGGGGGGGITADGWGTGSWGGGGITTDGWGTGALEH